MVGTRVSGRLLVVLVAVVVLGTVLPAQAGYHKMFRFSSPSQPRSGVNVTLNGLEVITGEYTGTMNPWGAATPGTAVLSGAYCSTLSYGGASASAGQTVKVGWNTSDGSCRLRDLRWPNGDSIVPVDIGDIPGGGYVLQQNGSYFWVFTNDTPEWIRLTNVEFGAFAGLSLSTDDLARVTDEGIVGELIFLLRAQVLYADAQGWIPDPSARSLTGKLDSATQALVSGLAAYRAGDPTAARTWWNRAIKYMQTFVSEVTTGRKNGRIREDLATVWVADANEIIERLGLLPEGESPPWQLPGGNVVAPDAAVTIPLVDENGQGVAVGDSVVLHGQLLDDTGEVLVDWADGVLITSDMNPPTVSSSVSPAPNASGWNNTPVTVTLHASDDQALDGIYYAVDPQPGLDPRTNFTRVSANGAASCEVSLPRSAWETGLLSTSGIHRILFYAKDTAGNGSGPEPGVWSPSEVVVKIDTQAPTVSLSQPNLWPPDHTMRPITIVVQDDSPGVTWTASVTSNQPDEGTGDGDYPNDIQWINGQLWLRAERAGNTGDTRVYTVVVEAVDIAGNVTRRTFLIPVTHDQGG